MNNLPRLDVRRFDLPKAEVRKVGRLLVLLFSLAVVAFLYAMVLTRGGILR